MQTVQDEYHQKSVGEETKESDFTTSQKVCFVVQGFGKKTDYRTGRKLDLDASYDIIKEAAENAGLKCIRADEIQHSQIIDKPIYEMLINADLVIADLSTSNMNAAYELGVRHASSRRGTIIVAEKQWDFPFDINSNAILTYEHLGPDISRRETKRFSAEMTQAITSILADEDAVDSPIYAFIPGLRPPIFHGSNMSSIGEDHKAAKEPVKSSASSNKMCFVVQGFGEKTDYRTGRKLDLDASYDVIKEAVENAGLKCIRADEIQHSQIIDKPMYESILSADLVIADLSTSNMNAAYELGVRHAFSRRGTIIVAEKQWDFPFDINRNLIRTYEHQGSDIGRSEARRFSADLTQAITSMLTDEDAVDSPLYTFIPGLLPPTLREPDKSGERELKAAGEDPARSHQADGESKSIRGITDQARVAMEKNDFNTAKVMYKAAHEMRPNDESIIQKLALATYKSKMPSEEEALWEAHDLIRDKLEPERVNDPETIGLWAAVNKRLWQQTQDTRHLITSINALERGFKLNRDYYSGINLAFMLNVRAGQTETAPDEARADYSRARRVRRQVIKICKDIVEAGNKEGGEMFWALATLWEASVGIEDVAETEQWEAKTKKFAEDNNLPEWMVDSTEEQIAKLNEILQESPLSDTTVA